MLSPSSLRLPVTTIFDVSVSPGHVCFVKRTLNRFRLPMPTQSVMARPSRPIENMPCPNTLGRPASLAFTSSWCIGLKSPDAPAYMTRSVRVSSWLTTGASSPSFTSSKKSFSSCAA